MNHQDQVEINFRGLHFTVDIKEDSFKVSNIRITNAQELADYIESDIDFDELMLKMVNKIEEREERVCQKKQEQEEN